MKMEQNPDSRFGYSIFFFQFHSLFAKLSSLKGTVCNILIIAYSLILAVFIDHKYLFPPTEMSLRGFVSIFGFEKKKKRLSKFIQSLKSPFGVSPPAPASTI